MNMISKMRTLVCFFGEIRATHTTFESIKTNLLAPLNADVFMCVSSQEPTCHETDPLLRAAKRYAMVDDQNIDYAAEFDRISGGMNWRSSTCIPGAWLQGLNDNKKYGGNVHALYKRFVLREMIKDVIDDYDWFVVTRPDLMWLGHHPPVEKMHPDAIHIPDGEDWGGFNDRHMVCSRRTVMRSICPLDTLFRDADLLVKAMANNPFGLNSEVFLRIHLQRQQVPVGRFLNMAFLTMDDRSPQGWSDPHYHDYYKVYYKFRTELESAVRNSGNTPFRFKGGV